MEAETETLQGKPIAKGYLILQKRGKHLRKTDPVWFLKTTNIFTLIQWVNEKCVFDVVLGGFSEDRYTYSGRLGQKQYKDSGIR